MFWLPVSSYCFGGFFAWVASLLAAAGQCHSDPEGSTVLPYEFVSILANKLIGYADDCNLMAVVPSPCVRVAVAESLNRDLSRVSEWCNLWRMKLN